MLNIKYNKTGFTYASGFTLIELMLAMLIGIVIMGGVMQMFMTTRDTQRTSEEQTQLVADARFVLDTMAFDIRHAGIWGGTNESKLIICGLASGTTFVCPNVDDPGNAIDDCNDGIVTVDWYRDLARPVFAYNNINPYSGPGNCANNGYQLNTDVLGLHYADSLAVPTGTLPGQLAAGVAYVRSNIRGGQLFVGNTVPASSTVPRWTDNVRTKNYPLRSTVYYVSDYTNTVGDNIPSLRKVSLAAGPAMLDALLIPGVESLQLEFGLDTMDSTIALPNNGKDGQVNVFVNAATVTNMTAPADPGANWRNGRVVAVKIWLLMRALTPDRDAIGGAKTYTLAGGDGQGGVTVNAPADGIHRFLMTRTVRLRNTLRRDLLQ